MIGQTGNNDFYDPLSITRLRMLKQDSQPLHDPDDFDLFRTRRSVGKALAMQTGRALSNLFNTSELGPLYRSTLRTLKNFRQRFRFRLQRSEKGLILGTRNKGKTLLELNLNFDVKRGVDPELTIANTIKFRYDIVYKRSLVEYGFTF